MTEQWPIPPQDLRDLVSGSTDSIESFLDLGQHCARTLIESLARDNIRYDDLHSVLDFGCGCGRTLRHLAGRPPRLTGTDLNALSVQWCRDHLPVAQWDVNRLEPPLPYPDASFDLLYAFSVLTHLPENLQVAWLQEFRRLLRPEGRLALSLLPVPDREHLRGRDFVAYHSHRAGANDCVVFQSPDSVRRLTDANWILTDYRERGVGQDFYLFRPRIAGLITGVVLAHNEARQIEDCLRSLRKHVDEIILIDMASTDGTRQLGAALADRVLDHPLVPQFDAARNIAIPAARHDWLWFLDADERMTDFGGAAIRTMIRDRGDQFDAVWIPCATYFGSEWVRSVGWWPNRIARLLKRGHFQFPARLHAAAEITGRAVALPADPQMAIQHYSFRDFDHYLAKLDRYAKIESDELRKNGDRWNWKTAIRDMARELVRHYRDQPHSRDDPYGWIIAWLSAQNRWLYRARLVETGVEHSADAAPDDLQEFLAEWQTAFREAGVPAAVSGPPTPCRQNDS